MNAFSLSVKGRMRLQDLLTIHMCQGLKAVSKCIIYGTLSDFYHARSEGRASSSSRLSFLHDKLSVMNKFYVFIIVYLLSVDENREKVNKSFKSFREVFLAPSRTFAAHVKIV